MKWAFKLKQRLILTIFNNFIYLYGNNSYGCSSKLLPVNSKYYNREVNLSIFYIKIIALFTALKNYISLITSLESWKGSTVKYVRKIFRKTKISNPLICTRTCAYQGVRNVSFPESFAYVLNGWLQNFLTADMKGL